MAITEEDLRAAVASSTSLRQVIISLNLTVSGAMYASVRDRIKRFEIDDSNLFAARNVVRQRRREPSEVLVLGSPTSGRVGTDTLRSAMLRSGFALRCVGDDCPVDGEWLGRLIVLHVDHINGVNYDNRPENLRFLCPNCHSQQPTSKRPKRVASCAGCGETISKDAKRCRPCSNKVTAQARADSNTWTKIQWPASDDLVQELETSSYLAVARRLGVSDNAIRARLRKHPPTSSNTAA